MKKLIIFLIFSIFLIAGCGSETVKFAGESHNWEGQYDTVIGDSKEHGEYIFRHKTATGETVIKNLKIVINDGEIDLNETKHKGVVIIPSACSGCAVTNTEDPIEVAIEWGDGKRETFSMEAK